MYTYIFISILSLQAAPWWLQDWSNRLRVGVRMGQDVPKNHQLLAPRPHSKVWPLDHTLSHGPTWPIWPIISLCTSNSILISIVIFISIHHLRPPLTTLWVMGPHGPFGILFLCVHPTLYLYLLLYSCRSWSQDGSSRPQDGLMIFQMASRAAKTPQDDFEMASRGSKMAPR